MMPFMVSSIATSFIAACMTVLVVAAVIMQMSVTVVLLQILLPLLLPQGVSCTAVLAAAVFAVYYK